MLLLTVLGMMIATVALYRSQSEQRALLATGIRTSGWVAYQAELEFVKTHKALEIAQVVPNGPALAELSLRMEILLSRLPLIYDSEEGRLIAGIDRFEPDIRALERLLESYLDQLDGLPPDSIDTASTVGRWHGELAPYALILQAMLRESVLFNDQVAERERRLAETPATVPVAVAFGSGGLLLGLLLLLLRRERRARRETEAGRAAQLLLEASLKRLIDAVPAGIVLVEPDTRRIIFVNPTAAALISPDLQHADWDTLIGLVLPGTPADTRHADDRTPVVLNGRDGGILSMTAVVREINWQGAPVKLIAMADTTRLRDTELQLVHASKLASLGEMASAIGHELNQPLSVIKLAAGNAMRGLERDADRDATGAKLRRIIEQVDRAQRITDQIRRYGTRPPGENRHFELRPAIDLAIGFVANQYRLAEIGLQTRFDLPAGVEVCGDQTMFEQVVVNLLVNAKDAFTEALRAPSGPATVRIVAHAEGRTITIDVADNAGGIAPEILDRLFHPFATTKPAERGTGLGLALARKVVSDMGGSIVGGNADGGARFTITVPVRGVESRGCP